MISSKELEELANLYDQAAHSLDPTDLRADQALNEFNTRVERLYISSRVPGMSPRDFKRAVISRCKAFLKRNR